MSIGSRESPWKWLKDNLKGEGGVEAVEKRPPPLQWLASEIRREREEREQSKQAATREARAAMSIERVMPEYAAQYKDRGSGNAWELLGLGTGYGILVGAYAPLKGIQLLHQKYDPKGAATWKKWYKFGKETIESIVSPMADKKKQKPKPPKRRTSSEEAVRSVREALGVPEDEGGTTPAAPVSEGTTPPAPTTPTSPEGGGTVT